MWRKPSTGSRTGCSSPRGCRRGPHHRPASSRRGGRPVGRRGAGREVELQVEREHPRVDDGRQPCSGPLLAEQVETANRSSSPQTPHDDPGGSPLHRKIGEVGSEGHGQTLLPTAASSVWLRDLRMPERYDSRTEPAVGRTHAVTCGRANVKARGHQDGEAGRHRHGGHRVRHRRARRGAGGRQPGWQLEPGRAHDSGPGAG